MRRRPRVDRNQARVIAALRNAGCSVLPLSAVGCGCPDLLVGFRGQNLLMEVKDGELAPSRRVLTPDQREFHGAWRGAIAVVKSVDEAIEAVLKGCVCEAGKNGLRAYPFA